MEISILQKYDYGIRHQHHSRRIFKFQFYRSTIMVCQQFRVVRRYSDFNSTEVRLWSRPGIRNEAGRPDFNSTEVRLWYRDNRDGAPQTADFNSTEVRLWFVGWCGRFRVVHISILQKYDYGIKVMIAKFFDMLVQFYRSTIMVGEEGGKEGTGGRFQFYRSTIMVHTRRTCFRVLFISILQKYDYG